MQGFGSTIYSFTVLLGRRKTVLQFDRDKKDNEKGQQKLGAKLKPVLFTTVETYDKKLHFSVRESGNFLFLAQTLGF